MKLDILAIGVHPDDIELGCAGTLIKHIAMGYKVGLCDLTMGQLGTKGTPTLRLQEAEEARKVMGALVRDNLGMEDGWFTIDKEHVLKIATVIRRYKPQLVLANAITDRHPDHGRASQLISEACFYSGLKAIELSHDGEPIEAWRPKAVYHYVQDRYVKPDLVVDITPYMEQKMACVRAFASQFYNPTDSSPQTPISSKLFLDSVEGKCRVYGRDIGVDYAEGFTAERNIGVNDLFDLS